MYLWVVLATFLAMMAAYVLPIREDTREMQSVSVAQAKLVQMIAKHSAGKEYLRRNAWPYWDGTNQFEKKVNYHSGRLDNLAGFDQYLPRGFVNHQGFITAIYCMNEDETALKTGADDCRKIEGVRTRRLLITYGAIPERWKAISKDGNYDKRPSTDLLQAMRDHFGAKVMAGYVMPQGEKTYIVNYENTFFEVPVPVKPVVDACLSDYDSCMAMMSWQ